MPGILDSLPSSGIYDPFEIAAARIRQGVMPSGGRREGFGTYLTEQYPAHVAQGILSLPQRAVQSAGELQRTGDRYDPGPALETAMLMAGRTPFAGAGELGAFGGNLRVAIKKKSGKVIVGEPGELHFDVGNRAGIRNDDMLGFVTPEGEYLTRKQALDWAKATEKLSIKEAPGEEGYLHARNYNTGVYKTR